MDKKQIIILFAVAFVVLVMASDAGDEEEEDSWECYPAFDKIFKEEFFKATQGCQYKPMKKGMRKLRFRLLQNPYQKMNLESTKVRTEQECHFLCYTFAECKSFRFQPKPLDPKCKWPDCNPSVCELLKDKVELKEKDKVDEKKIYGESDICTESMSPEAKEYFSSPDTRYIAAKADFLVAKANYDPNNIETVQHYAYIATHCLGPIIEQGDISEDEMGIAESVLAGNLPYMPEGNPTPSSKTVSITVRDTGTWKKGTVWVFTGLYALPGKVVTVTTPDIGLSQFIIKIGANKDPIYKRQRLLSKEDRVRDPEVTMDFNITSSTQAIGSVYGGLIIVNLGKAHALTGQTFDIEFDNVIEAPLFNLDTDTNKDWNSHIKNKPGPWSVFRIPQKITFVLPTASVKHITDVTTNLKEWEAFMKDVDYAGCVIDRKKGEIIVPDVMVSAGIAHSGYPVSTMNLNVLRGVTIFPARGTINYVDMPLGIGHEIGHNISPMEKLSHVAINLFNFYALPQTRLKNKNGVWGRKERLFGYMSAGTPDILRHQNQNVINDFIKLPMDGLDGFGWENEGNWDDMHKISCMWNREGPKWNEDVYDVWARIVCKATQMNMLEYFEFWNVKLSKNTEDVCKEYAKEPSKMMSWIRNIADLVDESAESCKGLEGWYGHQGKCYTFSSKKLKHAEASKYCTELGGELGIIANEKDAILANYAKNKFKVKLMGAWVGKVSTPADIFPSADNYEPGAEGQWLDTRRDVECNYREIDQVKGIECLMPSQKKNKGKKYALCQRVMV